MPKGLMVWADKSVVETPVIKQMNASFLNVFMPEVGFISMMLYGPVFPEAEP
jgi:hypothetical protein